MWRSWKDLKPKLKVSIKDASAAEKDIRKCTAAPLFKWHRAMHGPRCWYVHDNKYISTSRCGAEGARQKITWPQKICGRYQLQYLLRKELRVALPELRDLFMRHADFSAAQLVHWLGYILKGSSNFYTRNGREHKRWKTVRQKHKSLFGCCICQSLEKEKYI